MRNSNCQMVLTMYQISKIILNNCIKKHKTLTAISPINVHINRFVFKIEDGYKLELPTSETKKLFGSTKKIIHKTKN